jgi:vancomycin permeability regulator SanA
MYHYCLKEGVPEEDIFLDHAGFSTYDSVHRAQSIFKVERMIVVTQTYHEFRALYTADQLGIRAIGVSADQVSYPGAAYREVREVLARAKDFFKVMIKAKPVYGGEEIPITGSPDATHV